MAESEDRRRCAGLAASTGQRCRRAPLVGSVFCGDHMPNAGVPTSEELLTVPEVAKWLGLSQKTLYRWRSTDTHLGPPSIKVGGRVRYRAADVRRWLEDLTAEPATTH